MIEAIGALTLTVGLFVSAFAPVVLIAPKWSGAGHRIFALPMSFGVVGSLGLVALLVPGALDKKDIAGTQQVGAIILAFWAVLIAIAMMIVRQSKDPEVKHGFWTGFYVRWISRGLEHEARLAYQAKVAEEKCDAEHQRLLDSELEKGREAQRKIDDAFAFSRIAEFPSTDVDERLTEKFERYRQDLMTLDEYERAIQSEADDLKLKAEDLRDERKFMVRELYEFEKGRIDEDREAISWRKRWLTQEKRRVKQNGLGFPASGKWSRFEYVDADGVVTNRHVVNWERRGRYIVGYDKGCNEERTFRQDRISDWLAG